MPIEIACSSCNKRLRVPDNAAGKRVRCPQCKSVISVPAAGGSSVKSGSGVGAQAKYHLKTEDGQTFGPVPKQELDEWFAEGRITAECQILRDGAQQWQWASDLYPQLEGGEATSPSSSDSSSGGFPTIDTGGAGSAGDDNPFAFAAQDSSPTARISGGRRTTAIPRTSSRGAHSPAGASAASGEVSDKSKVVAGLLELLVPLAGIHGVGRFYLGYTGIGIAQLLTFGGCGIWSLIDGIMMLMGKVPDADGRPLKE